MDPPALTWCPQNGRRCSQSCCKSWWIGENTVQLEHYLLCLWLFILLILLMIYLWNGEGGVCLSYLQTIPLTYYTYDYWCLIIVLMILISLIYFFYLWFTYDLLFHFLLFHLLLNFAGVVPHDRRPCALKSATRHWHSVWCLWKTIRDFLWIRSASDKRVPDRHTLSRSRWWIHPHPLGVLRTGDDVHSHVAKVEDG